MRSANVLWFRHGLRLHDNPALLEAIADCDQGIPLIPVFIFDGESAGTQSVAYNRMRFLLESLQDLNDQLLEASKGECGLYLLQGNPKSTFERLHEYVRLRKICFEQDCEPIWNKRDRDVKEWCQEMGVQCVEKVSHTLWDPKKVIATNGGIPPLTYQMFLHTVEIVGLPPRPVADPKWHKVSFLKLPNDALSQVKAFRKFPTPEDFNIYPDNFGNMVRNIWKGGERQAIVLLADRLKIEEAAFQRSHYLPNHATPNIVDSPKSMSPHLRFGCLSVRRFYWDVQDLFRRVQQQGSAYGVNMAGGHHITGQLIWREYFYTMSVLNPHYDRMQGNDICLTIPWAQPNPQQLHSWKMGRTGFPIIDAAMRQLLSEGWVHHTLRNMVATFLTRGGLWQNWEFGLRHFLKYLLDADWSVCAGNWMWVSSSAFEQLLDSSVVACPVAFGKRLDPRGEYIKQYVPELRSVPDQYIHEPWRTPSAMQKSNECVIGVHYPERIIDFAAASKRNMESMKTLRNKLMADDGGDGAPPHCRPSNDEEIRNFFWLAN